MSKDYRSPEQPEISKVGIYEFETFDRKEAIIRQKIVPRRAVVKSTKEDARLSCGHTLQIPGPATRALPVGYKARCWKCYHEGIEAAGRMIGEPEY